MAERPKPENERDQRLRAALRENLERRKAQARARAKQRATSEEPHDSAGIVSDKT